jgi:chemotaxis protein methyltransferase CheR
LNPEANTKKRFVQRRYDIIFFRNAMIYFSAENRRRLLDILADALVDDGILFLGVSEVSSVVHPLLANKCTMDTFYFQKLGVLARTQEAMTEAAFTEKAPPKRLRREPTPGSSAEPRRGEGSSLSDPAAAPKHRTEAPPAAAKVPPVKSALKRNGRIPADIPGIAAILDHEEGSPNARKVLEALGTGAGAGSLRTSGSLGTSSSLTGNELIAGAIHFLGAGDFGAADLILSFLEKEDRSVFIDFLRGEYHYRGNNAKEAEAKYKEAAGKDKAFWPAFYRISSLAAEGNRILYEHKIKKALESIELGKDLRYESFIGGFSPDYYRQILERKLAPSIV